MQPRRIVNIINFVRYDEPRVPTLDLFEPVREQMRLLKRHGLPCTWLLQYDAMVAGPCEPLTDDLSSVAYWYRREPHAPFPRVEERWGR